MKKHILWALFFSFMCSRAVALSEVEFSGEMDITASVWNLPTGERGNSSFTMPSLFLNFDAPLQEGNLVVVRFEGSEEKSLSQERFDVKVREAYLDVVSIFEALHGLRCGLVPQTWQEAQYETWGYRFLGTTAWAITEKWKYLNYSDLGFSYMSAMSEDDGEWAFTLTNGEGAQEKELGPRKEAALFVRLTPSQSWTTSFNYVFGGYEKYGSEVNRKERIQALIIYQPDEVWLWGLEYLKAQDPADALREYGMAEGVDVVALTGKTVTGQGGSIFTVISTGEKSELMLRYDYMNVVEGVAGKDMRTSLAALGYQATEDMKISLAVDHTAYGSDFAPGVRDRSKLEFAAQVHF
jgi:hypothetical protein